MPSCVAIELNVKYIFIIKNLANVICLYVLKTNASFLKRKTHFFRISKHDTELMTPIKLKKGQKKLFLPEQLFSTEVSRVRQPIESLFSWLQENTGIYSFQSTFL